MAKSAFRLNSKYQRLVSHGIFCKHEPTLYTPGSYQSRRYPHRGPNPYSEIVINCSESARQFVAQLDNNGRAFLLEELTKKDKKSSGTVSKTGDDEATVSLPELKNLFLYNGVPFIGFGFLDNMVMIIAGEYIDVTLGVTLGITTMAAAALGNLISDVAGIGSAGYVELLVSKIGITHPELTRAQASLRQTRYTVLLGRVLGITIGCILGMFPLFWFDNNEKHSEDADGTHKDKSTMTETDSNNISVSGKR